jgi:hypothetical protein
VLHLPVIVEAAESSPQAAAAAAYQIRKFLQKDSRSRVQYNAIMLVRILADNPGPSFTRNIDDKFVSAVKDLVKNARDGGVQQMMRETLDSFEAEKSHDNALYDLVAMWRQVKGRDARIAAAAAPPPHAAYNRPAAPLPRHSNNQQQQQQHSANILPPPQELSSRVEEARNTARILLQLLQSTPPEQVVQQELIKEFAERCQSAQRNMQQYIACDAPPPDDDTMLTLIETNEQLSLVMTRHQRAILQARRALGATASPSPPPLAPSQPLPPPSRPLSYQQPNLPPPAQPQTTAYSPVSPVHETYTAPPGPPPNHPSAQAPPPNDPFADPVQQSHNHHLDYTNHHPDEPRNYGVGAVSNTRPAYGGVTDSYMGRHYSAANHLTMHGGVDTSIPEDVSPVEPTHTQREVRYRY